MYPASYGEKLPFQREGGFQGCLMNSQSTKEFL